MKCSRPHCNQEAEDAQFKTCRRCRDYQRKYRETHPEKMQEYRLALIHANPEKNHECKRKWCAENIEKERERYRKRRIANLEKERERIRVWGHTESGRKSKRKWDRNNRDKKNIFAHNYRARKRANGGTFTFKELNALFEEQEGFCFYCGELLYSSFDKDIHIDHKIPVSRGGPNIISNIALTCAKCNLQKGAKTDEEFLRIRNR